MAKGPGRKQTDCDLDEEGLSDYAVILGEILDGRISSANRGTRVVTKRIDVTLAPIMERYARAIRCHYGGLDKAPKNSRPKKRKTS